MRGLGAPVPCWNKRRLAIDLGSGAADEAVTRALYLQGQRSGTRLGAGPGKEFAAAYDTDEAGG